MFLCFQIIYAWARDAPKLLLPEGVGFKVGGDSPIQYLVLQVHYVNTERFKGDLSLQFKIHISIICFIIYFFLFFPFNMI